jgi:hypothetical protein
MSFSLTKNGYIGNNSRHINVFTDYTQIAQAFCLEYYTLYDDNIEKLKKMYHSDAKFVYLDNEFDSFNTWLKAINDNHFWKFTHYNMNVNVIPICDSNLSITITGKMSVNNGNEQRFTENIILQKDNNNNFYICTTMFKIIE